MLTSSTAMCDLCVALVLRTTLGDSTHSRSCTAYSIR